MPPPARAESPNDAVMRVGQLVLALREVVEQSHQDVWVEGEVLDSKQASSGHLYFTLIDPDTVRGRAPDAQLRCIVFLSDRPGVLIDIASGARVRVRGRASVFPAQSSLQLIVTEALAAGLGDRAEKLAKLKAKLQAEGLFAAARKRPLPRLPRSVGLLTSKKGAAFHDVISVARRRFPVRIVLAHCTVQGPDAARSIVAGLDALARLGGLDVVIVARGGGASEDLSAFDDERVVRAVAAFPVPVVSGVGHEVDVTLTDLAADRRAATPSNAAELVVPDRDTLRGELALALRRLQARFDGRIQSARLALERSSARLASRRGTLRARREQLRATERVLERAERKRLEGSKRALAAMTSRLSRADPRHRLSVARADLARLSPRVARAMQRRIETARSTRAELDERLVNALAQSVRTRRHALAVLVGRLDALSPLAVLSRGYAIALDPRGRAITRASEVKAGERIEVRVEHGRLLARVEDADE